MEIRVVLVLVMVLSGCATAPKPQVSPIFGDAINAREDSSETYEFMPQASLFFPNGALLDMRAGTMPYYWYSNQEGRKYFRPPVTMLSFYTSNQGFVAEKEEDRSKIQKITFGKYDGEDTSVQIAKFVQAIENSNKLEFKITLNNTTKGGTATDEASASPVVGSNSVNSGTVEMTSKESTTLNNTNKGGASTNGSQTVGNNSTSGTPSIDKTAKESITLNTNIPYIIFSYKEKKNKNIELNAPLDIIKFNKKKDEDNIKSFIALYPSIYTLQSSKDMEIFLKNQSNYVNSIKYDSNGDCAGFSRGNGGDFNQLLKAHIANCPYAKFWLINFLITAKAIIYLNNQQAENLINAGFKMKDNGVGSFMTWINESLSSATPAQVELTYHVGNLSNLTTAYFNKNSEKLDLMWSCRDEDGQKKCLPIGAKESEVKEDIPIYAVFNLNPDHMYKLVKNVPLSQMDLLNMKPVSNDK